VNIFRLSDDPVEAARWHVDRHVLAGINELVAMMSTAHRVMDGHDMKLFDERERTLYKATHVNHPASVWVREAIENYWYAQELLLALLDEYTHRYGKRHAHWGHMSFLLCSPPKNLEAFEGTAPPTCMPEEYRVPSDPVLSYRNYYRLGKTHLHSWKNRTPPTWIMF